MPTYVRALVVLEFSTVGLGCFNSLALHLLKFDLKGLVGDLIARD